MTKYEYRVVSDQYGDPYEEFNYTSIKRARLALKQAKAWAAERFRHEKAFALEGDVIELETFHIEVRVVEPWEKFR